MKANYLLKHALVAVALFGTTSVFGQAVVAPTFTEVKNPVIGTVYPDNESVVADPETGRYPFGFTFECAVAWGDYNNDGFLDVMTSGHGHSWSRQTLLYKNNGDGTFTLLMETPFPKLNASNVTWFDYNNDGNLDVFLAGYAEGGRYSGLWKNLGSEANYEFEEVCIAEFEYINNEGGNKNNRYAVAADYDNDGWVDLYFHGYTDGGDRVAKLYKNINGERFEEVTNVVTNPVLEGHDLVQLNGGGAFWGDYDNDGDLDLIASGWWNSEENPNYDPNQEDSDENQRRFSGYIYAVYKNNGDGTFTGTYYDKKGVEGDVVWHDYNNDGALDYMIQGVSRGYMVPWYWVSDIYHNNGDGTFESYLPAPDNGLPNHKQEASISFGDVNNDGFEDILFMNADPNAIFYNNNGDGDFTRVNLERMNSEGALENYSQWGGSASFVDYDNDGDLDAFTAAYGTDPILQRNDGGDDIGANEAPSVPTNLDVTVDNGVASFSWDASTDDLGSSLRYNLFVKHGNVIKSILPADLTTGRLKVNETLAPLITNFYTMKGLPADFTWGVQAIDNARLTSAFATAQYGDGSAIESPIANQVNIFSQKGIVKITSSGDIAGQITVFSVNGAQVYNASTTINNTTIELPAGVYTVKVTATEGALVQKVIVK